ncbi:hypothetical protein [Frankia sp. R82]|uniref:hypothetical protein n=1 Tax=Frankia sp. R82 TaxID=2950553 RepID=UPI002043E8E2|nr:hypothetical protein [Frankia sp. R82]MCM3882080.1 hypothetical protein [Frankia sp. R82]
MQPLLPRVAVALLTGTISFGLTTLAHGSVASTLTLGVFVAGAVLVVEFLRDVERSMSDIERTISQVNDAARLRAAMEKSPLDAQPSAAHPLRSLLDTVVTFAPPSSVLGRLVTEEIRSLTALLHGLTAEGPAAFAAGCEGEDRDWLLALTRAASRQIFAISTTAADGGRGNFEDGFWKTELGRDYLNAQRAAVERGVAVRRIFILTNPDVLTSPDFVRTCEKQASAGVEVRTNEVYNLSPSSRYDDWTALFKDFILFDDDVSYEVELEGVPPTVSIARTNLRYHRDTLRDRRDRFDAIWEASTPFPAPPAPPPDAE